MGMVDASNMPVARSRTLRSLASEIERGASRGWVGVIGSVVDYATTKNKARHFGALAHWMQAWLSVVTIGRTIP